MFGNADNLLATEQTPFHPVSPYGLSKAAAHELTRFNREKHGVGCWCGTLFNHDSVLRSKNFVNKKILASAIGISRGVQKKLSLENLDVRRDWGYAPDYVEAMCVMLQMETPTDYIICSGEAHSLEDFVDAAFSYLSLDWRDHVIIDDSLRRSSDIQSIFGKPDKARREIGWSYNRSFKELNKRLIEDEIALETMDPRI